MSDQDICVKLIYCERVSSILFVPSWTICKDITACNPYMHQGKPLHKPEMRHRYAGSPGFQDLSRTFIALEFAETVTKWSSFCYEVVLSEVIVLFYLCSLRRSLYGIVPLRGDLRGSQLYPARQFSHVVLALHNLSPTRWILVSLMFREADLCPLCSTRWTFILRSNSLLEAIAYPSRSCFLLQGGWFFPRGPNSIGKSVDNIA